MHHNSQLASVNQLSVLSEGWIVRLFIQTDNLSLMKGQVKN